MSKAICTSTMRSPTIRPSEAAHRAALEAAETFYEDLYRDPWAPRTVTWGTSNHLSSEWEEDGDTVQLSAWITVRCPHHKAAIPLCAISLSCRGAPDDPTTQVAWSAACDAAQAAYASRAPRGVKVSIEPIEECTMENSRRARISVSCQCGISHRICTISVTSIIAGD